VSPTFRSLRVRNYRLFATGQVISVTGTWAQAVAQDWLVLELTGSATALGITMGLQFLPTLLFGLWGGVVADRYPKRRTLVAVQSVMGVLALALGVLTATGAVQLWHVYVLAGLLGLVTAVDTPVRQAFVAEMVEPDDIANAVALNSAIFNMARIVGPALAGVLVGAVGVTPVFFGNAVSYLAVLLGLLAMDDRALRSTGLQARGTVREGLRYVRGRRDLVLLMVLSGMVATIGMNFRVTLSTMAKDTFHGDAGLYGALSAAMAGGALTGALVSARRQRPRRTVLIGAAATFGVLELVTALMPTVATMMVGLYATGFFLIVFNSTANATAQLSSSDAMRGRVMALYSLVFLGGIPIGGPLMGWVVESFGARMSLAAGGATSLLTAIVVGAAFLRTEEPGRLRRYRRSRSIDPSPASPLPS
jgi:MFS family permease